MNASQFFLEQYNTMRTIIEEMVMKGASDEQLRCMPIQNEGKQNSLAWLLWHVARWEDIAITMVEPCCSQLFSRNDWQRYMNLSRCDTETAMTAAECSEFNATVNLAGLWAYWRAVGQRTREVVELLGPEQLETTVDGARLRQVFADGVIGNERAVWVEEFFANRSRAWWLSFVVWHAAEHLLGEALCVRRQAGIPLGL